MHCLSHFTVMCWVLMLLSLGMKPGIIRHGKDREGSNRAHRGWMTKRSQQQHWSHDDRNLDYCSSHLNPLTSHHSESGLSTHLKTKPWTFTLHLVPILSSSSTVALWINRLAFSWRFTCSARHRFTTGPDSVYLALHSDPVLTNYRSQWSGDFIITPLWGIESTSLQSRGNLTAPDELWFQLMSVQTFEGCRSLLLSQYLITRLVKHNSQFFEGVENPFKQFMLKILNLLKSVSRLVKSLENDFDPCFKMCNYMWAHYNQLCVSELAAVCPFSITAERNCSFEHYWSHRRFPSSLWPTDLSRQRQLSPVTTVINPCAGFKRVYVTALHVCILAVFSLRSLKKRLSSY